MHGSGNTLDCWIQDPALSLESEVQARYTVWCSPRGTKGGEGTLPHKAGKRVRQLSQGLLTLNGLVPQGLGGQASS